MADDLGYHDLGCYGSDRILTPHLDRLAEEGIRFTDYHSNGAVCSPTRAALMTGRYQQRSGIEGVVNVGNFRHTGLSAEEYTMAEHLSALGYVTGIAGKWHLGYDTIFSPLHHGFDFFKGYVSGNIDYHSHIDQAGYYDWWVDKELFREEGYTTDLITKASIAFIRQYREQPFFLYVAHEAPHYPFQGRNDQADRTVGGTFPNQGSRIDKKSAYKEMIEVMDEGIGEIIETLEELDLLENTFLFFCSDNGAMHIGSNFPLRGFKGKLWEGGHRVPAIAYWKDHIQPGTCGETLVSMDLFPTLTAIAGGKLPDVALDGVDFQAAMYNGESLEDRPLFWRFHAQEAVRSGTWKLLLDADSTYLYNLETDPGEQINLADQYAQIADSLRVLINQWNEEMSSYPLLTE